ncbi:MAG: helix-hairpin-helix domain-containing protein [Candidatus Omnitrophica bacterium]|nr:helix-hairpin-helix domain-containing protein [Candidatus Omnitrophota bacterium]MCM8777048.1 helix-hairpin-helix domain-containing protein [Candidatus Omnitrophota bacterium]
MSRKLRTLRETARFDVCGYTKPVDLSYHLNSFIYPAVGEKGRVYRLFKVLLSNFCKANCFYCMNRKDRDYPRYRFEPAELAGLFFSLWKKGYVDGLFLSSSIDGDANNTQEKMNRVVEILRKKYNYSGYIHLKVMPGVDENLIKKAFKLSSRLSLNIEAPGTKFLKNLSPDKDFSALLLKNLKKICLLNREYPLPAGITSQIVVGAGGETDRDIMGFIFRLYRKFNLKRVYYSGFEPIIKTPMENLPPCAPLRELRLYQADILIKQYGFSPSELVFDKKGNLLLDKDPKLVWAENNPERFPVEVNNASIEELVRVPGIGLTGAQRIISRRKEKRIGSLDELNGIRINISLSSKFLTFNGRYFKSESCLIPSDENNPVKEEYEPVYIK